MPRRKNIKITDKIKICNEAASVGNVKATARKYNVFPYQIRYWRKQLEQIKDKAKNNVKAFTVNSGKMVEKAEVEKAVYEWIIELRQDDIPVSSSQVIAKSLSIAPDFHGGNVKSLWSWVYTFYKKFNLSIRAVTHQGQKLHSHIEQVKRDFGIHLNQRFGEIGSCSVIEEDFICNMDQTAVFFECKPSKTVNVRGSKTIPIRNSGSNSNRMTVCLAVTLSGKKLPPFVIFKENRVHESKRLSQIYCPRVLKGVAKKTDGWTSKMHHCG